MSENFPEDEQFKKQHELDRYRRWIKNFLGQILPLITDLEILKYLLETVNFEFTKRHWEIVKKEEENKENQDSD